MKLSNIQKVTFAWASTVIGSLGAVILVDERNYVLGIAFILLALGIEVVREYLKKKGIDTENQ